MPADIFNRVDLLTLPQLLERSRNLYGSDVAFRYFDDSGLVEMSYEQLYWLVMKAAGMLRSFGIAPGDKVAILSENMPQWGAAYFSVTFLSAIVVPLDTLAEPSSVEHVLRHSEAKAVIASGKFIRAIKQIRKSVPSLQVVFCLDEEDQDCPYLFGIDEVQPIPAPVISPDDVVAIVYTSGTTGLTKGVMLSHGNIISDIAAALMVISLHRSDRLLSILPLSHVFECTCGFLLPLSQGASITYGRGLAGKQIVEDIRETRATIMLGVPLVFEKMLEGLRRAVASKGKIARTMFRAMTLFSIVSKRTLGLEIGGWLFTGFRRRAGLRTLRLLISGGAPLPAQVSEALNALGLRLIQGYGLTEAAPVLTLNPPERYKNGSIGKPLPGVKLRIERPDEKGCGQLVASGPMIMKGYYGDPSATQEALRDGWLYTGDLGRMDDEGYFYIVGRVKNLIVTPGGKKVHPEEIESVLSRSPHIAETLVVGRPVDGGEEVEAIVVPNTEYLTAWATRQGLELDEKLIGDILKREVVNRCREMAVHKRVKHVSIRQTTFEKTSTKKIRRYLYLHKSAENQAP